MKKVLLVGLFMLFSLSLVLAAQPLPHAFEGQIISKDNTSTNGKTLIAKLDGAVTAQTKIQGNSFKITVVDNTGTGGLIRFYIGEEEALTSYTFKAFEVTKNNLTFNRIPDQTVGSCGDAICAVGECSFCAIDCTVTLCNNNNVCDVAIGEDYVTAPNDCVSCGDGVCNNGESCSSCAKDCGACATSGGSSGSSGGGGGGGGSTVKKTTNTTTTNNVTVSYVSDSGGSSGLGIGELNEETDTRVVEIQTKKPFFSFLTGWAVTEDGNGTLKPWVKWTALGIVILAIAAIVVFVFLKKKIKLK
jgi:hypothetical protein